jgi:formate hydrogenlyase subunit 4
MTLLLATIAQALHCGLVALAAPSIGGLLRWIEGRLAGRSGPSPLQPWRDLTRLARKQTTAAENASALFQAAPPVVLAATVVAVSVVPSFSTGMLFAGIGDLLLLAGLITLARASLALAALDAGTASGGLAAARATSLTCFLDPAVLLAVLALGVLGGTTNLDVLVGLQRVGMLQPSGACALAAVCLSAVAVASAERSDLLTEFSGVDLAMVSLAGDLRVLFWFNLIAAVFLPIGMATTVAGPLAWIVGVLAWALKLAVMTGVFAAFRYAIGHSRQASMLLGATLVLGLLATVVALASSAAV